MSKLLQITFATYPILISGISFIWQYRSRSRNRSIWAIRVLTSGSMFFLAFLIGSWAFTSYYFRYVFLGLFTAIMIFSFPRGKTDRFLNLDREAITSAFFFLLFTVLNIFAIASHFSFDTTVNIAFPFRTGVFYVLQGGSNAITNPFHEFSGSKHALDIVKLNSFGNRADGIAPADLSSYSIFDEVLFSPCHGTVIEICDSLPDNSPGKPAISHPKGNYILLNCLGIDILVAHLKQSSIKVTLGEVVEIGQPLAKIGNSGNTLEPHLHMYAKREGRGIGLTFNGKSLSINSVIIRK